MVAFVKACNVDFEDGSTMDRHWAYLWQKKPNFTYLRRHQHWEAYYKRLLEKWLNAVDIKLLNHWAQL
jgi:hypothetical protein